MKLQARLIGGPLAGRTVDLGQSVPYELNLQDNIVLEAGSLEVRVPDSEVLLYRRRGGVDSIGLGGEPTPYVFVGPTTRASRRK